MKHAIRSIGTMLVLFALVYLIGCFTQVSFSIADWTATARGAVGAMGGVASIIAGVAAFAASVVEEKTKTDPA